MYQSSVRSATAGTGKTLLAIVAILSLTLSLFAFTQPVAADHDGFSHQPLPIDTSTFVEDPEECEGVDLEPGQVLLHWIANQQNVTEPITLTLFLEGGGELSVDSNKWNTPAMIDDNVTHHFDLIVDGDIVIEDLDISTGEGNVRLSHVCRGEEQPELGSITFVKDLIPADDPGQFRLQIFDRNVNPQVLLDQADGGDGTTAMAADLAAGTYRVVERALGDTDLADYDISFSCVDNDTDLAVAGTLTSGDNSRAFTFELAEGQDVTCTVTNELIVVTPGQGMLEVDKFICLAADSSTEFEVDREVVQSFQLQQTEDESFDEIGDCMLGAGVEFQVFVDTNENGVLDVGEPLSDDPDLDDGTLTTNAGGTATVSLEPGFYILVEPEGDDWPGGSVAFEIADGEFTIITVTNNIGILGSLLIAKEDEEGDPLGGAGFTLNGGTEILDNGEGDGDDRVGFICVDDLTIGDLFDISETTVPSGFEGAADQNDVEVTVDDDCDTRDAEDGVDATFVNVAVDTGFVKVLKYFCTTQAPDDFDNPHFIVLDENAGDEALPDQFGAECTRGGENPEAFFTLDGEGPFGTGDNGILIVEVPLGSYTLTETSPLVGSADDELVLDTEGETVTALVLNFELSGEQPEAVTDVMVMKHVCPDEVQSEADFDALNTFSGDPAGSFLDKVLACPVITMPGDVGPAGALDADDDFFDQFVEGGDVEFNFSVAGSNGAQNLVDDGTFVPAQVCETDLGVSVDGDATVEADVCLEVSHYSVSGTAEGLVAITETDTPDGFRFGSIEFTPGSDDAATLVSFGIGTIVLNTTADADGTVMVHVYNFAEAEQQGGGAVLPGQGGPASRGGVLGGQLPNTATAPASIPSMPALLLAVAMLTGLAAAAYAVKAEVARRR